MRTRSTELEIMDRERVQGPLLARVAGYLRFINRWTGVTRGIAGHLGQERGPVTVLDVAAGAGDIALDLARLHPNLKPVALDLSGDMLALARGLPRVRGDARRLPVADRGVDWVISTHFFHHLREDEIVTVLREFDRVARRGIVVSDLLRRQAALIAIRLMTLWANPVVKVDGPISVRRGFRTDEVEALARRAGVGWLRMRVHLGHRFTLAGTRPG